MRRRQPATGDLARVGGRIVEAANSIETLRTCGAGPLAKMLTMTHRGRRFAVLVCREEEADRWIRR